MPTHDPLAAILDAIDCSIAMIDGSGRICYVNQAWTAHGLAYGVPSGHRWIGASYLDSCRHAADSGERDGAAVLAGIQSVIGGWAPRFAYDYACHGPGDERWFSLRVAPAQGTPNRFVIWHQQITDLKQAERRIREENRTLSRLARTDSLTRLANRMQLDLDLSRETAKAQRDGTQMALILADIDRFKQINDGHGHQAGDAVLRQFAAILRRLTRASDFVGRWGGEEFLVILPGCALGTATQIAEAMCSAVRAHDFRLGTDVSCSFGVAAFKPGHQGATLLACADSALYAAKQGGRDRVQVAHSQCGACMRFASRIGPDAALAAQVCGCH